uniref:Uncharacterized protein n=1 Tax=Tanacetum cinerariifolium TaxID=118510 RepID=A0A6L2LMU3_TANCI|nr:hypothetical protein [Tanacetum cinerariifolium]
MAEQPTIKYAPQWNNMTVDNVTFQTNNVVGNFNYPLNVPAYKLTMKFLLNFPLNKAFTNCPSVVYQNFLREFWSTPVAYDPFPSTDETEQHPLREFLIKFLVLNGKRPLTLDFNTFCLLTGLDYNNGKYVAHPTPKAVKKELGKIVLGGNYSSTKQVNSIQQLLAYCLINRIEVNIGEIIYSDLVTKLLNKSRLKYVSYPRFISCTLQVLLDSDYTQDENFGFLLGILSNSNFTTDPSKVTDIELAAHIIVVNNRRDLVSPLPLTLKPKKRKSQTVTPTLPKSHGSEASGALSKKRQNPKSKKPPIENKITPHKPTKGYEQSHSGTRKSQPLPEGTDTHPKDSGGNSQPLDMDLTSMASDKGTTKTMPHPEGSLGDKESGGNKPPADMEPIHPTVVDPSGTDVRAFLLSDDETQESKEDILRAGKEMDEDPQTASIEKHEEATVNYANLKASIDEYYDENTAHRDQTNKLVEASMSSLDQSSTTIHDLYKGLNIITELLKEINNAIKDDPVINKKISEATKSFTKISTNTTEVLSLVKGFNFSDLQSFVNALQAHALKQDKELDA